MLMLLERLTPVERAVFVLRESFDLDYGEIAEIVDRGEDNCRQILTRARRRWRRMRGRASRSTPRAARRSPPASSPPPATATSTASSPCSPPDAVLVGDGGGKARSIPHPIKR